MPRPLRLARVVRLFALPAALWFAALPLRAQSSREQARAILEQAVDRQKDAEFLRQSLDQVAALAARTDADSYVLYAQGWLLSHLERNPEAIVAYRRATQLPPPLADAHYNLGVLLSDAAQVDEALRAYDATVQLNPEHVDALYNAGQGNYDLERYGAALAKWRAAQKLTPNDFQIARKVLQALNALGLWEEAALARDEARLLRSEKRDPSVAKLTSFCFDQIPMPDHRVFAYELFAPDAAGTVWEFRLTNADQSKVLHRFHLRRGEGSRHVLVAGTGAPAALAPREFPDQPSWRELKPVVREWAARLVAPQEPP